VSELQYQRDGIVETEVEVRLLEPDSGGNDGDRHEERRRQVEEAPRDQPRAGQQDHLVDEHRDVVSRQQVGTAREPGQLQQHGLEKAALNPVPRRSDGPLGHVRNPLRDFMRLDRVVQEEVLQREVLKAVMPAR